MVLLDCYWLTKKMGMEVEYREYMKYLMFMDDYFGKLRWSLVDGYVG